MSKQQQLEFLLDSLQKEYRHTEPQYDFTGLDKKSLLRALMNIRPPNPVSEQFLQVQDDFLQAELREKPITDAVALAPAQLHPSVALWRGDITMLAADAIVNAANSAMLGCFVPCHKCIDNAIHSAAGVQLREECHRLMELQGHPEPTGRAKITNAYNLPCRHVIHTVGPICSDSLTKTDCRLLADCYRACLALAEENDLASIAFCCISTGEFRFPQEKAAEIAVQTIIDYFKETSHEMKVIFNVFTEKDQFLYRRLLGYDPAVKTGD